MLSTATKQILNIVNQAEQIKSQLQKRLQNIELKKAKDELQFKQDQAMINRSRNDPNMDTADYMREAYNDKKTVMDDEHEIAELKKKLAGVDRKISEINHWTAQSEYEDPKKQSEAVEMARRTLQSI